MLDNISQHASHVITSKTRSILHRDNPSIINQREMASTRDRLPTLRSAFFGDPDVILVGEMRDMETIETALHAETGHRLRHPHPDATETINRTSRCPAPAGVRSALQLAAVIKSSGAMLWCPSRRRGRAPAAEVLVATPFIKDCIVDKDKTHLSPARRRRHVAAWHADVRSPIQPSRTNRSPTRCAVVGVECGRVQLRSGHFDTSDASRIDAWLR